MMKYERFTWKAEKLQHSDDEVLMVVDNANKDWKGHILNIVDLLNSLAEENEQLRTLLKERQYEKDIAKCREENEHLRQTMQEVCELLTEAIDLFSDATYYLIPAIKKAIKLLKGDSE